MSATDLVAFGWGRVRPVGGDRHRGTARLLRAAQLPAGGWEGETPAARAACL